MCGLVGIYSSNFTAKHKDVLSAMLYLDTWRGRDSTGVAAIRHNSDTHVLKSTVPGYEFVEGPKLDQHLRLNDFCWIGHNRHGTMGKNIKTNAHPFMIDDEDGDCCLVGAHNGTLRNKHVLTDANNFGTDSEALFSEIAFKGLEEALKKVEGAWALTYYDHIESELRIIRNKERPLFYAFEEGKKTFIWASEMWMIRVACSKYGVKLQDDNVFTTTEDTLYRLPAPVKVNDELTLFRKGGVVGKEPVPFFQQNRWPNTQQEANQTPAKKAEAKVVSIAQSGAGGQVSGALPQKKNETSSSKTGVSSEVSSISSGRKYRGFQGKLLTQRQLEDQLENGCSWCELEFIDIKDRFAWLAPNKPVCHKCITGVPEQDNINVMNMVRH